MKLLITDLAVQFPSYRVNGASGKEYVFDWDKALNLYVYTPKSQTEIDDIFRERTRDKADNFFTISVLLEPVGNAAAVAELSAKVAGLEKKLAVSTMALRVRAAKPSPV
ncbi:MAG: hypothetical protein HYV75_10825 [Opitutae bacterium]|nr:hypothetical protein [Opitutae bacterium]